MQEPTAINLQQLTMQEPTIAIHHTTVLAILYK